MLLFKDGITVEMIHPAEIARFKRLGYAEVKEELPEKAAPAPKSTPAPKKGGEQ